MKLLNFLFLSMIVFMFTMCSQKHQKTDHDDESLSKIDTINKEQAMDTSPTQIKSDGVLDSLLYFSKGACFGKCPVFSFVITKNGGIHFDGKMFLDNLGVHQGQLSDTDLRDLYKKIDDCNYFELEKRYPINPRYFIPDLPNTTTEIHLNNKSHKIVNNNSSPIELTNFEKYVEDLILNHPSLKALPK